MAWRLVIEYQFGRSFRVTPSGFAFKTVTAIFPAAGYRENNTGQLNEVGNSGRYWSSSPNSTNGYMLNFNNSSVNPDNNGNRDLGRSVRCVAAFITFLTWKTTNFTCPCSI